MEHVFGNIGKIKQNKCGLQSLAVFITEKMGEITEEIYRSLGRGVLYLFILTFFYTPL